MDGHCEDTDTFPEHNRTHKLNLVLADLNIIILISFLLKWLIIMGLFLLFGKEKKSRRSWDGNVATLSLSQKTTYAAIIWEYCFIQLSELPCEILIGSCSMYLYPISSINMFCSSITILQLMRTISYFWSKSIKTY